MKTIESLTEENERLHAALNVLAERQAEIIAERDALRADRDALIDSRQAVIDERNVLRANLHRAVNDLRTSIWGYAQYLHNLDHTVPITNCHRGICPGVRGLLRRTEAAEDPGDTAVYVGAATLAGLDEPPPECNDRHLCLEMRDCAAGCDNEPPDDPAYFY